MPASHAGVVQVSQVRRIWDLRQRACREGGAQLSPGHALGLGYAVEPVPEQGALGRGKRR
jgi:hypothetical protein